MKEKVKEESRRNTYVFQGFLTQNFFFRTSRKIQDLVGGAIVYSIAQMFNAVNTYVKYHGNNAVSKAIP